MGVSIREYARQRGVSDTAVRKALKQGRITTESDGSIDVERHSYQLYLAMEDIDHSKTKANHPQTNGICERFHRTMKNEFYDIAFRKKIYHSLEELQTDVDHWIAKYNEQRPHSGKYCYGKTPMQTFREARHLVAEKTIPITQPSDSLYDQTQVA